MKNNRNMDGIAMIEVLLAVVVLAIGLLASSRMQLLGLSFSQGALTRSYATMAANDIIDRMRLNIPGVDANAYDAASTDALPGDPNCLNVGCNPAELAATDLFIWGRHFRKGDAVDHSTLLPPNAVGTITRDADVHKVKISWQDLVQGDEEDRFVEISVTIQ